MEDWNMLAADCVVISCCCQCLILQILILVLLKLPYKLVKKTKEYAKRFQERRKNRRVTNKDDKDEYLESYSFDRRNYDCRGCMEDVEKVMRELSDKGEFGFGSFWSGEGYVESPLQHFGNLELDNNNVVQYQFIQMVGSFGHSHSQYVPEFRRAFLAKLSKPSPA